LLAFMAGGLVVFMLMPKPIPPPVTPPAAVSAPQAPPPPVPVKRRRGHRPVAGSAVAQSHHRSPAQDSQKQSAPASRASDSLPPAN
jgi:hypothetical protein